MAYNPTTTGNGVTDTGTTRVTLSNDSTGQVVANGNVAAAATDSGNPVKVGGKYNLTQPTYTNGQRGDLQLDANGNLRATVIGTTGSGNTDNTSSSGGFLSTNSYMMISNSLNWDRVRTANIAAATTGTGLLGAGILGFDGTNYRRILTDTAGNLLQAVNLAPTTTGDTGAKTTTGNGATQTNVNARGANILFNVGTVSGTSPTCVFKVQSSSDGGTTFFDIPNATTTTVTASGVFMLSVYPGNTALTNQSVSYPLGRTWRVVWTIGGTTPSFTITNIQVGYIV